MSFIERSFYLEEVPQQKGWKKEKVEGSGIEVPLYVIKTYDLNKEKDKTTNYYTMISAVDLRVILFNIILEMENFCTPV